MARAWEINGRERNTRIAFAKLITNGMSRAGRGYDISCTGPDYISNVMRRNGLSVMTLLMVRCLIGVLYHFVEVLSMKVGQHFQPFSSATANAI